MKKDRPFKDSLPSVCELEKIVVENSEGLIGYCRETAEIAKAIDKRIRKGK